MSRNRVQWAWLLISISMVANAEPPSPLAWKSHGRRSLVGCSPWGCWESDMTERLHFPFSLSCIGEGMAAHSSALAWRIPGTGEPGGLPSIGSHRVGHDWSDLAAAAAMPNHSWLGWFQLLIMQAPILQTLALIEVFCICSLQHIALIDYCALDMCFVIVAI